MKDLLQQVIFGLANGAIYALIALGFALTYRTIGLLNFSLQQFVMMGGLVGYSIVASLALPLAVAIVVVPPAMAIASVALERVVVSPIRKRQGEEAGLINMIIATIGAGLVMVEAARLIWGGAPLSYPSGAGDTHLEIASLVIPRQTLIVLAVAIAAMVALQLYLGRTWTGRGLRATAEQWGTAKLVGIDTDRMVSLTFALTGGLAGLAGVLISWLYVASFSLGDLGVKAVAAAVLGGFGSLPGAVLGGLLLGVSENLFSVYVDSGLTTMFVFGLVVVMLVLLPRGLLGQRVTEAR
jgi:branched-chain amino acid transport system permease protein